MRVHHRVGRGRFADPGVEPLQIERAERVEATSAERGPNVAVEEATVVLKRPRPNPGLHGVLEPAIEVGVEADPRWLDEAPEVPLAQRRVAVPLGVFLGAVNGVVVVAALSARRVGSEVDPNEPLAIAASDELAGRWPRSRSRWEA